MQRKVVKIVFVKVALCASRVHPHNITDLSRINFEVSDTMPPFIIFPLIRHYLVLLILYPEKLYFFHINILTTSIDVLKKKIEIYRFIIYIIAISL